MIKKVESNNLIYSFLNSNKNVMDESYTKEERDSYITIISNYMFITHCEFYAYEYENEIVGVIGMTDNYISLLCVNKKHQKRGIARKLVNYVQNIICKDLELSSYRSSEKIYLKLGFQRVLKEMSDTNILIPMIKMR